MISKQQIMLEWRKFVRCREHMVRLYTQQPHDDPDTPFADHPHSARYPPGSPARAPASLATLMSDL
jgi:hypothetical protein